VRLILHHAHLDIDRIARRALPDDTLGFMCIDDFSVGPLSQWHDGPRFYEDRSAFWRKTELLSLPDGSQMDYSVWHQTLPRHDLVEMVQSGIAAEDIPMPQDWQELVPTAKRIEVWHDGTVRGQVFLWYTVAALNDLQTGSRSVSICNLPDRSQERQSPKFWSDMLWDRPDRVVPASPLSESEQAQALRYWDALTRLPEPVEPSLLRGAEKVVTDTFLTLSERHPSRDSGLTNIQARLLRSTRHDWQKMAMTIGDAMVAGIQNGDPVGDMVLQAELNEMARMTPPLVEIEGKGAMRFCRVRLTAFGEAKGLSQTS
jgi:hypothetical protein